MALRKGSAEANRHETPKGGLGRRRESAAQERRGGWADAHVPAPYQGVTNYRADRCLRLWALRDGSCRPAQRTDQKFENAER